MTHYYSSLGPLEEKVQQYDATSVSNKTVTQMKVWKNSALLGSPLIRVLTNIHLVLPLEIIQSS